MENKRDKGLLFGIIAMVIAVISTGVAFAALSTTLNVNGVAEVDPASWKVHFADLSTVSTVGAATVTKAPTINGDSTVINEFDVTLTKPGDSASFTVYVENIGTLDAKIGNYTPPVGPTCTGTGDKAVEDAGIVCNNLTYSVSYVGGTPITVGDTLAKTNGRRQIQVTITYDSLASALPENKVEITNLGFSMIYIEL